VDSERILEILFAVGVVAVAVELALIAWGVAGRATAAIVSTAVGAMTAAAWVVFALEPGEEQGLAAAGLTVCLLAAVGGILLDRALVRGRRIDAELARTERRLRDVGSAEVARQAEELERLLSRARADTLSEIAKEERRIADERRRELAERERQAGAEFAAALADAERRVEARLAGWAQDLERAQHHLSVQLEHLSERQRRLLGEAEARIAADVERLSGTADDERVAIARVREELATAAAELVSESNAELEAQALERRRALHELSERLRRRERELFERIEREEADAAQRISAAYPELERRVVEQLERANERAWTRFSEAAALQFADGVRQAREEAALRLSRELDRAVESFAREAARMLAEQASQVADTGVQRLEKRVDRAAAGFERQRDEVVVALEQRLGETENEFRRRLQAVAAEAEAERLAIEVRVQELAQRVEDVVALSRERLAELQALRIR
jgi:hypothetical protein